MLARNRPHSVACSRLRSARRAAPSFTSSRLDKDSRSCRSGAHGTKTHHGYSRLSKNYMPGGRPSRCVALGPEQHCTYDMQRPWYLAACPAPVRSTLRPPLTHPYLRLQQRVCTRNLHTMPVTPPALQTTHLTHPQLLLQQRVPRQLRAQRQPHRRQQQRVARHQRHVDRQAAAAAAPPRHGVAQQPHGVQPPAVLERVLQSKPVGRGGEAG